MKNGIHKDGYQYCSQGDIPPKCEHLENSRRCTLYLAELQGKDLTNMDSGRDEWCIERCEQCMKENK